MKKYTESIIDVSLLSKIAKTDSLVFMEVKNINYLWNAVIFPFVVEMV